MNRERRFWNERYFNGQISGKGSVGKYRKWKWGAIEGIVNLKEKSVLDVGCGDLNFIRKKKFAFYLGLDISDVAIKKNQKKRPDLNFFVKDVTNRIDFEMPFDVVLCMDLLFHIMTEQGFKNLLSNLNRWTGEFLFVVNWSKNPLPYLHDDYQYFRDLTKYLDHLPDLQMLDAFVCPFDPYNMIYVFRRRTP